MRLIATIIFIIELLFIPGVEHVYVPDIDAQVHIPSGIPYPYYKMGCVIPLGMKVDTWLTELAWPHPLKEHVWDCSQTAAYTEWALENCGYESEIILTIVKTRRGQEGHAYIRVKIDGEWYNYETTARWKLTDKTISRFSYPTVFKNIFCLYHFCLSKGQFLKEFGWWKSR